MLLAIKLLLLEILLFNLESALSIKKHGRKNKTRVTTVESNFDQPWGLPDVDYYSKQLPRGQYNHYDNYSNSHNTTTSAPHENLNSIEFYPDTEHYNNTPIAEEEFGETDFQLTLNGSSTNNTNSSADHFYTQLTSNVPNEFPWKPTLSNEKKESEQEEPSQIAKPPLTTNTPGIFNYNRTTLPKCPNGFNSVPDFGYNICYILTEPTSFPPQCPYPSTTEYYAMFHDFPLSQQTHWAFTYRNTSDVANKHCFIFYRNARISTSCTEKFPGVCAYNTTSTDYCRKRYNASCISHNYDSPTTCYCRVDIKIEKPSRTAFCTKLVEITNPYQNNNLIELLNDQKPCWIGLHKYKDSYQWSSTNTTSNYTFWSRDTDFSKTYGALGADGWMLEEDGALNCAICEMQDKDPPQVHLHIGYNKTTNTLDVEITNPIGAFQLTCFAQNSDDYKNIDLRYNKTDFVVVKESFPFLTSGYYWCKALQIPNLTPVYSNTIFIATNSGHEYALSITLPQPDTSLPETTAGMACNSIRMPLTQMVFDSKPVKIIKRNEEDRTLEVLCHIALNPTQESRVSEFDIISNRLTHSSAKITNLTSIEACLPSVTISASQTLHWPETPNGATTIPEELCLQSDGSPVTRTCAGDFYYGSHWLDVTGTCADVEYSDRIQLLHNILKSNTTTSSSLGMAILNITEYTSNFTSFEIHLVSKALEKLAAFSESPSVTNIAKTVNNIMHLEPNQLRIAQETLNSTDMMLYTLDEILARTKIDDSGYMSEVTEKLVVQISDLKTTKVNGIKLEKTQHGFDSTKINALQHGTSQGDLMKENLDLALLIPEQLHNDIVNCMGEKSSFNLITTVFYDDVLFNEPNTSSNNPDGRIIGVTIPNFNCTFTTPLQVIFNPSTNNNTKLKCASWVYGFNDVMESTHGEWFIEGDPNTFGNSTYQVCEFSHITHFTLLILGGTNEISEGHKKALDIITAVGSGLSILGLLIVFLTAIIFKSFRSANAVVINFSVAMTAQIVLLFVADNVAENKALCTVFGAVLHYIVLAQFCWMLTIAILQYRRYVVIFASPTPYLVVKTCACSWGIPLIPVIIIISISRDSYGENSYGLCYALGNYFIFGVLIPVSLILFINLMIFLRIMLSIASSRKVTVHQKKDDTSALQLRLAIMLYFLLGLTWGFGLLAAIGGGIVYSYLFCITATLQGFILFLYFIVLNEKTRSLWTNMKTCHCKGKSDEYDVNTDSAATAMMRRPRNTASSNTNTSSTTSEMLQRYKNRSSSEF